MRGNCYVASEALYHLLGGKAAGWKPMCIPKPHIAGRVTGKNDTHWFLKHSSGLIVDPTVSQFRRHPPDYSLARGCGFLTKQPSKRAVVLMGYIMENTND